jgi:hypothetical protein
MTQRDPLSQFRRQEQRTQDAASTLANLGGLKPYEAYKAQDRKPERLEIRRLLAPTHAPSYRYLMDVSYDGGGGTIINLIYSFVAVEIKGRNLQPVAYSIVENRCDFIQDYDPREHAQPEPDKPVIDSIKFYQPKPIESEDI